jgi:hypothetical protein
MKVHNARHRNQTRSLGAASAYPSQPSSPEAAEHVAQILIDLRRTAKDAGLGTLAGLLEIAYYEAYAKSHPAEVPEEARKWIADMEKIASRL